MLHYVGRGAIALAAIGLVVVIALTRTTSHRRVAIRVSSGDAATAEALAIDVWSEDRGAGLPLDVVVTDDALDQLRTRGVAFEVLVPDIDAAAAAEYARLHSPTAARPTDWFGDFRDYTAISARLHELAELAPDRAEVKVIGASIEGRPLWALRIGHGPNKMLLNGTQHAREWIAAMTATCVADRLVRDYDRDPAIRALVDRSELWIVPVVNPDGYQFSWGTDRYWRKNRRDRLGVDLNRNFSVAWGGAGSSRFPRSDVYRGAYAFSEPETAALRDLAMREHFAKHVDFHAYGQLILYPWNYTGTPAKDRDLFAAVGDGIASAMFATHQNRYALQPGIDLYAAAGTMTDWMYGEAHTLSYTIELRPKGGSGFVLPPEQIKPTCDEGLAALLALAK
ncbi:MAG TPA: M14 family zinc carboxypeptidase [Kofleriaceae bacterium]